MVICFGGDFMRYFIVKKEGINLSATATASTVCVKSTTDDVCVVEIKKKENEFILPTDKGDVIKTNTNLNSFIAENIELIRQISPVDPAIPVQDEWRTEDYSEYDKISNYVKQRGKTHGKGNQAMGCVARRFSLRRKP